VPVKPAPAAARACEVLAALSRDPSRPHTLSEVARALGISRGSCQAVLVALVDAGLLLRHEPSLTYVLGPACLTIGDAARNASPVLAAAEPEMWALRDLTGLGIAGMVRAGVDVRVAVVAASSEPFALALRVGHRFPYAPPFGTGFVAWADDAEIEVWLERCEPALTTRERAWYRSALTAMRARGFGIALQSDRRPYIAIDPELPRNVARLRTDQVDGSTKEWRQRLRNIPVSHTDYLVADKIPQRPLRIAQLVAPIFDQTGEVAMALSLVGPSVELVADDIETLGNALLATTTKVSAALGAPFDR
jgi:DNA-binding IclR family transcriptional regulator